MITTHHTRNDSVRTVLFLSPAVAVSAIVHAQRHGLRMQEWLDKVVVDACAGSAPEYPHDGTLTSAMTVDLFARVASHSPGLLTERWHLLFEIARLDDSLWDYPETTLEELEADPDCTPNLNIDRLRRQWPRLLAQAFAL